MALLASAGCQRPEQAPPPPPSELPVKVADAEPAAEEQTVEEQPVQDTAGESDAVRAARSLGTPTDSLVVTTASGLQYIDVKVGDGTPAKAADHVSVHYTGWLVNGSKFDSSKDRGQPFEFPLGAGRVIKGWDEGVAGMQPGGVRKLIIPSDLGYGPRGAGAAIPPNATLIFEVDFLGAR
jgi:FKBP-type peptidyl-prolyl cis-trans isomerase FkpA